MSDFRAINKFLSPANHMSLIKEYGDFSQAADCCWILKMDVEIWVWMSLMLFKIFPYLGMEEEEIITLCFLSSWGDKG